MRYIGITQISCNDIQSGSFSLSVPGSEGAVVLLALLFVHSDFIFHTFVSALASRALVLAGQAVQTPPDFITAPTSVPGLFRIIFVRPAYHLLCLFCVLAGLISTIAPTFYDHTAVLDERDETYPYREHSGSISPALFKLRAT